jgi:serine/threonine protein kinase
MPSCPGEGALRFLGTDALGDGTYAAIEQHVEGCQKCQALLERLAHRRPDLMVDLPDPERWPRIPGFEIQSELGRGAMGVVYLAIETGLDRLVALKILPGAQGPDATTGPRRRWLREARAISSVRHPNVVPLHDYGEADGWFFLVLEFIPGGTLKQRLAEPLPARVAAGLVATMARALGYIHSRGLLHLDLKPSNILLDCEEDGLWDRVTPRISDFGLALSNDDAGASEKSLAGVGGTPSYMAPEQATAPRGAVGAAADIYALGAILYELLTGRAPFQGTSMLETLDQVRSQQPVPPRRLNPKISRDLETIALKCLEKNPSRRYASALALADDLSRFLDRRPIKARHVSPLEHSWRWCRRQPVIAALAVTLFLTVVGSFLALLALLRRSETLRSHSEANYHVAARSLDEIIRLLSDSRIYATSINSGHELEKTLEIVRSQEMALASGHAPRAGDLERLATIDCLLAQVYFGGGKHDQGRTLMEESIGYCERSLAHSPLDVQIRCTLFGAATWMAMTYCTDFESDQLYEQWHARAIRTLEGLKSYPDIHVQGMYDVSRWQRERAMSLRSTGESERARKELEKDLDFIRSVPAAETAFPRFVFNEALTLAALGRWSGEFPHGAIQELELTFAERTASRFGWPPSGAESPPLIPDDLSTEAWVDRVISTIKTDAATFHLHDTRIPAILRHLWTRCANALAWQRRSGKLGDARRFADRWVALFEQLTRSYPDQAAAYILLSEAYVEKAKNAYRAVDEPVIGWEQQALDAAVHAETLEPTNEEAHRLVKDRRRRLDRLESKSR